MSFPPLLEFAAMSADVIDAAAAIRATASVVKISTSPPVFHVPIATQLILGFLLAEVSLQNVSSKPVSVMFLAPHNVEPYVADPAAPL